MNAPVVHTWRLAPRWVIALRIVAAFIVVGCVVTPIALALHTVDVRNIRRQNLSDIATANANTAQRIAAQQRILHRQEAEISHSLKTALFEACTKRNEFRDKLVVIVSGSPKVTKVQIAKFRRDLGYETCPPKPAPLPPVSPPLPLGPKPPAAPTTTKPSKTTKSSTTTTVTTTRKLHRKKHHKPHHATLCVAATIA